MKKLIITIVALALTFTYAVSVTATDEFVTSADLFQHWEETTYPDYVCGVWSNDGTMNSLTIAVQDNEAGNAGKQEILDLISDDSTVTFIYQEYSLNYLRKVQEEIFPYFEKDIGLVSTGVNEYKNRLELGILEEKSNDVAVKEMIAELQEKYGDIFIIEYSSGVVTTLEEIGADFPTVSYNENEVNNNYIIVIVCVSGAVLAAIALTFAIKKKNAMTLQTNTGETLSASASLSTKEVENMVKNSNTEVSSELNAKIMSEIENR